MRGRVLYLDTALILEQDTIWYFEEMFENLMDFLKRMSKNVLVCHQT